MAILTHGRDLNLAPTIGPIVKQTDKTVRGALNALVGAGFTSVQLDATLPGIRPRELSSRSRQDLLALLTRRNVRLAGLDMFVPRTHFLQSDQLERAVEAILAGIALAADLGRVPLSIALPVKDLDDDIKHILVDAADGRSIRLAVHAEDQLEKLMQWVNLVDLPALGCAIDPAAVLNNSQDTVACVQRLGKTLAVARLSDVNIATGLRCPIGGGDLDTVAYRVMLDLATNRTGPVVLDLRGHEDALSSTVVSKAAWDSAAFSL